MIMVDEFRLWLPRQPRPFHDGSSHLTSDESLDELHAFAKRLGLRRGWFQPRAYLNSRTAPPDLSSHYDLTMQRRADALVLGAVFVPQREQVRARMAAAALAGLGKEGA